eukprot:TRINITY_DN875_c0_g1_i3.p1 TRINITY_DN875_c0_g1~~TRINITY_DN875_c0_g1_i3.p1  ORF type:complete len:165 (-),score=58.72 TRINITY_DN875_c0_g1_i3:120-614(-)
MSQLFVVSSNPKKHTGTFVLYIESAFASPSKKMAALSPLLDSLCFALAVPNKSGVVSSWSVFIESLPVGSYVMFTARQDINRFVAQQIASGCMGYVSEHLKEIYDILSMHDVTTWTTEPKTTEEIADRFNITSLTRVDAKPSSSMSAKRIPTEMMATQSLLAVM